jgi:maleamate amidohydrolase
MEDILKIWSGEPNEIGFGDKPGIVVVDFQEGFTKDPGFIMGGAPLIDRAVENSEKLLKLSRKLGVPIASCNTAYANQNEMPYWKPKKMKEILIHGHPSTKFDPRIHDPKYDYTVTKSAPSIFFETGVASYFIKQKVDTIIVTGCVTSACIRATVIDSFSYKFRTIVPEDCVGDREEESHWNNLYDIERRYCDVSNSKEVINYLESVRLT